MGVGVQRVTNEPEASPQGRNAHLPPGQDLEASSVVHLDSWMLSPQSSPYYMVHPTPSTPRREDKQKEGSAFLPSSTLNTS